MTDSTRPLDLDFLLRDTDWVRNLARRLVSDPHAADDLVQNTWLDVLRAHARPRGDPRSWLGAIVRNSLRREGRRNAIRRQGEQERVVSHAAPPTDEILEHAELQREVIGAVTELDEPYRTTVLLHYFKGLSIDQLSHQMGVPSSTGRTRLKRSLEKLRGRFDREYGKRGPWCALLTRHFSEPEHALICPPGLSVVENGMEILVMGTRAKLVAAGVLLMGVTTVVWRAVDSRANRGVEGAVPVVEAEDPDSHERSVSEESRPQVLAAAETTGTDLRTTEEPREDLASEETQRAANTNSASIRLNDVAATFLTGDPDAAGLYEVSALLAGEARVDPESLEVDEETGTVTGRLDLGEGLAGSFTIDGSFYSVELGSTSAISPFLMSRVHFRFKSDRARAAETSATVQFHPDTRDKASKHLREGERRFVGWSLATTMEKGTTASPMEMEAQGHEWRIGNLGGEARELNWLWDTSSYDAWLSLLQPHAGH